VRALIGSQSGRPITNGALSPIAQTAVPAAHTPSAAAIATTNRTRWTHSARRFLGPPWISSAIPRAAPLEFNREKQQIHRVCLLILNPGAMRQDADGVSAAGVPAACPEPCRNRPRLWAGL